MKADPNPALQWKSVRFVGALHNRVEFAQEVQRQFREFQPDAVAVEYPNTLREKILQAVERLPLLSVVHYQESDGALTYLLPEPTDAQVEAIRLALAEALPVHFIDRDTEAYPPDDRPMPDSYAVQRIGHLRFTEAFLDGYGDSCRSRRDLLREMTMAYHLQRLSRDGRRILFVGGLSHLPGLLKMLDEPQAQVIGRVKRSSVGLAHLHEDASREVLSEMPFLAAAYETVRTEDPPAPVDRLDVQEELIRLARASYWKQMREEITVHQLRVLNRFARNYALLAGRLTPSFYQLIVAARGAVDDNFAYEVWDKGSEYPWQSDAPGLPVLRLTGEDLYIDEKRIRFHRRLKSLRTRLVAAPVRKRIREQRAGEWKDAFDGFAICSYPPEDVAVEGYGRYLQRKALEIKAEDNVRIQPFTSSMMDGLDIRETIRDWVSGKIYVKEERPLKGKVGSVVVIFDPDLPDKERDEAYPWRVTWLGEHDQESDMAFYSTSAGEVMDGPGISRCQYGGFMLTYPPMRVYDIWRDSFFDTARNKPERLLMAAVDYSLEKQVVYLSPTPPSGWCRSLAARLGKKIIYLPLGTVSPVTLKRIRQFHVLDGHHVRRYARQYIGV